MFVLVSMGLQVAWLVIIPCLVFMQKCTHLSILYPILTLCNVKTLHFNFPCKGFSLSQRSESRSWSIKLYSNIGKWSHCQCNKKGTLRCCSITHSPSHQNEFFIYCEVHITASFFISTWPFFKVFICLNKTTKASMCLKSVPFPVLTLPNLFF